MTTFQTIDPTTLARATRTSETRQYLYAIWATSPTNGRGVICFSESKEAVEKYATTHRNKGYYTDVVVAGVTKFITPAQAKARRTAKPVAAPLPVHTEPVAELTVPPPVVEEPVAPVADEQVPLTEQARQVAEAQGHTMGKFQRTQFQSTISRCTGCQASLAVSRTRFPAPHYGGPAVMGPCKADRTSPRKGTQAASKRPRWFGHSPCAVLRWLGSQGVTVAEARAMVLLYPELQVSPVTVQVQVTDGRSAKHHHGQPAELTEEQQRALASQVADLRIQAHRDAAA